MGTTVLFPGMNAILLKDDRFRFIHNPKVQSNLFFAERCVQKALDRPNFRFIDFLNADTREITVPENIPLMALAISAIQVGVFDSIKDRIPKDTWLMGLSLGDLSRSVCSGMISFEDMVGYFLHFSGFMNYRDKVGANIAVSLKKGESFTEEDRKWFYDNKIEVSYLTSRYLNIGAAFEQMGAISRRAEEKGWKVRPLMAFPVHSCHLDRYVKPVIKYYDDLKLDPLQYRVYSTYTLREVTHPDTLKKELLECLITPIHWAEGMRDLMDNHNVQQIINIGPCRSLRKLAEDVFLPTDQVVWRESSDLIDQVSESPMVASL